jgi:hypothetical protein
MPTIWIPSRTAPNCIWLQAEGAALLVGAQASTKARFARVAFPELGPVYLLLRPGPDASTARAGLVTVPNLARDLIDGAVAVEWLASVDELPAGDAAAIVASISYAGHAARTEWREVLATLPEAHPVRRKSEAAD